MKKIVAILVILLILFGIHFEKPQDNIGEEYNYFQERLELISATPESVPSPNTIDTLPENTENNETEPEISETAENEITVYITESGTRYHKDGCRYLKKSKIPIELSEAAISYQPCQVCKPPKIALKLNAVSV